MSPEMSVPRRPELKKKWRGMLAGLVAAISVVSSGGVKANQEIITLPPSVNFSQEDVESILKIIFPDNDDNTDLKSFAKPKQVKVNKHNIVELKVFLKKLIKELASESEDDEAEGDLAEAYEIKEGDRIIFSLVVRPDESERPKVEVAIIRE